MVNFFAVCGCCTRTDIVREHLEDTLRICDVSAMGLYFHKYPLLSPPLPPFIREQNLFKSSLSFVYLPYTQKTCACTDYIKDIQISLLPYNLTIKAPYLFSLRTSTPLVLSCEFDINSVLIENHGPDWFYFLINLHIRLKYDVISYITRCRKFQNLR